MSKDPNYDRYKGIRSLPGDPLNPNKRPQFRVDEDGNVIYRQASQRVDSGALPTPHRVGQAGILDWDELDRRAVAGQENGHDPNNRSMESSRNIVTQSAKRSASAGTPSADEDAEEIVVNARRDTREAIRDLESLDAFHGVIAESKNLGLDTSEENALIRQRAHELRSMGTFAPLRTFAPPNHYSGSRPEPGSWDDIKGKIKAAPVTIPAAIAGVANLGIGAIRGNDVGIRVGDNAIQFLGGGIGQGDDGSLTLGGDGAVTLGNVQLYSGKTSPDHEDKGYGIYETIRRVGDHEEGHTYQFEDLGVGFFKDYLDHGLQSKTNPFEQAADHGARGGSPYPEDVVSKNNKIIRNRNKR